MVIVSLSSMDNLEKRLGVTPLDRLAHQMHEIYSAFVNAGFTPDQIPGITDPSESLTAFAVELSSLLKKS